MNGLMFLEAGRRIAGVLGALTLCFTAFAAWNGIQAKLPEYMGALHEIRTIRDAACQLENLGEMVKERLRLKQFLVQEVLQKKVGWKDALGTYSWLCAQSRMPSGDLNLMPNTREGIERLVESFSEWAAGTNESEFDDRKCQLYCSFEETQSEIDHIEPLLQVDILTRFQDSEKWSAQ